MVAVVGLDDVVVVDTPDALLVTTRARAQEVKQIVAALKESGRPADLVTRVVQATRPGALTGARACLGRRAHIASGSGESV